MTEEDLRIVSEIRDSNHGLRLERHPEGAVRAHSSQGYVHSCKSDQTLPVYAAENSDPVELDRKGSIREEPDLEADLKEADLVAPSHDIYETLYFAPRHGDSILHPGDVHNPARADQSSRVIRFRHDRPRQTEATPLAQDRTLPQYSDVSDLQLQLRKYSDT